MKKIKYLRDKVFVHQSGEKMAAQPETEDVKEKINEIIDVVNSSSIVNGTDDAPLFVEAVDEHMARGTFEVTYMNNFIDGNGKVSIYFRNSAGEEEADVVPVHLLHHDC